MMKFLDFYGNIRGMRIEFNIQNEITDQIIAS